MPFEEESDEAVAIEDDGIEGAPEFDEALSVVESMASDPLNKPAPLVAAWQANPIDAEAAYTETGFTPPALSVNLALRTNPAFPSHAFPFPASVIEKRELWSPYTIAQLVIDATNGHGTIISDGETPPQILAVLAPADTYKV